MLPDELQKCFVVGDRVIVSAQGGWVSDFEANITSEPEPVNTLQGVDYFYWVDMFHNPQYDLDGDGPYINAQVLSCYLRRSYPTS